MVLTESVTSLERGSAFHPWGSILENSFDTLAKGDLLLMPTDTTWALCCDATRPDAVAKLLALKGEPAGAGLVVLVNSIEMLRQLVGRVHPRIETILGCHQRPLTVIYNTAKKLASGVAASNGTVAVRICLDSVVCQLITRLGHPIVATLPRTNGYPVPQNFGQINSDILQAAQYVMRYRQEDSNRSQPSVIIGLNEVEEIEFLRF